MAPAQRRRLIALLAFFWICASAPADGAMIGEPVAVGQSRQFRLESELDFSRREVKLDDACCADSEALRLMVKFSGRVHERVELFGRLGGALVHTLAGPGPNIHGEAGLAIGGGLKATLHEQGAVALGAGAQILFHESNDGSRNADIEWHEIDLFAGPSIAVRPDTRVYGGLLASFIVGKFRNPGMLANPSGDLEARRAVGIFLGGHVQVTRATLFGLELRLADEVAVASRIGIIF